MFSLSNRIHWHFNEGKCSNSTFSVFAVVVLFRCHIWMSCCYMQESLFWEFESSGKKDKHIKCDIRSLNTQHQPRVMSLIRDKTEIWEIHKVTLEHNWVVLPKSHKGTMFSLPVQTSSATHGSDAMIFLNNSVLNSKSIQQSTGSKWSFILSYVIFY